METLKLSGNMVILNKRCDKCDKVKDEILPLHTCPYRVDINGDSFTECNCCKSCTIECLDDI